MKTKRIYSSYLPRRVFPVLFLVLLMGAVGTTLTAEATLAPDDEHLILLLVRNLTEPDIAAQIRRDAAVSLFRHPRPEAQIALLGVLSDRQNNAGRLAVCQALAQSRAPQKRLARFVEPLFVALADSDETLRTAAAAALARSDGKALKQLLKIIKDPHLPLPVRIAAIESLAQRTVPDLKSLEQLVTLLSSPDGPIRDKASEALKRATGAAPKNWEQWFKRFSEQVPQQRLESLIEARDRQIQPLRRENFLLKTAIDDLVEKYVLSSTQPKRSGFLLDCLKNDVPAVRLSGLRLADKISSAHEPIDGPVREQLRLLLTDPHPKIRTAATNVIRSLRDPNAANALLAAIKREKIPTVQIALIDALAVLRVQKAVIPILHLLKSPDGGRQADPVVSAAAAALGFFCEQPKDTENRKHGSERVDTIRKALLQAYHAHTRPDVRAGLLDGLSRCLTPKQLPLLIAALQTDDPKAVSLRVAAARALKSLPDPPEGGSSAAADVLAETLEAKTLPGPILLECLNSLAHIGNIKHLPSLLSVFTTTHDGGVRDAALKSISAIWKKKPDTPEIKNRITLVRQFITTAVQADEPALFAALPASVWAQATPDQKKQLIAPVLSHVKTLRKKNAPSLQNWLVLMKKIPAP